MSKWLALILSSLLSFAAFAQGNFVEGQHYKAISEPVVTSDPSKVEVVEVFWYGCPHCNDFSPVFEQWESTQGDEVNVQRSPAMWNKRMATHATIFYTAKVLGKLEVMHKEIFDAMHVKRKKLLKPDQIYALFQKHDIDREKFDKTFKSFGVKSMVQLAESRARSYGITGTPEVIVNGKYRVSANLAGSQENMLKVIDFLVQKEKAALADS